VDQAIKVLPNAGALHEFRALTLFAMKKYKDAAGVIYSELTVGPGWTWDTVKSLYAKQATDEQQLKALTEFSQANPKGAAAMFLLAYHCLLCAPQTQPALVRCVQSPYDAKPSLGLAVGMGQTLPRRLHVACGPGTLKSAQGDRIIAVVSQVMDYCVHVPLARREGVKAKSLPGNETW
jgi:hypothetical protein